MFWIGLGVGLVCGSILGVFITAILVAGRTDN